MNRVVVERSFEQPANIEELSLRERAVASCLSERGVSWIETFVSVDARRMLCVYEAPDAEAVRYTQDRAGLPYQRAWSGQLIEPSSPPEPIAGYSLVMVERDLPADTTQEQFLRVALGAAGCMQSHRVRFYRSVFGGDSGKCACVYSAPDAESVRIANVESGLPMRRAWSATRHAP